MRTTINIADDIFRDLQKVVKAKTKTETINRALEEFVRMKRIEMLLSLRGKVDIDLDIDALRDLENYE